MPNTYNISRLEPLVKKVDGLENAVVSLVVGLTGTDEGGRSAYIDTMVTLEVDKDNFVPFEDLDLAWANKFSAAPRLSAFFWGIISVCLLAICAAQHMGIRAMSAQLNEIAELARMQGGWVYFEIKDD